MEFAYKTIWVVDDVEEMIYAFISAFASYSEYRVEYAATAVQVKAKPGDIVFLDLNGTKAELLRVPEGVSVFRMTGGVSKADLRKPFTRKEVDRLMTVAKRSFKNAA